MSSTARDPKVDALNGVMVALKSLEKEEQRNVLKTAADWLSIEAHSFSPPPAAGSAPAGQMNGSGGMGKSVDPNTVSAKEFIRLKIPKTDVQRLACLGYILQSRGKSPFNSKELGALNHEAQQTAFSNLSVTLKNATRQNCYFSSLPKKKKQLTSLGEQVVEALPNQAAVDVLVKGQRKPRKKRSVSKKTQKPAGKS